MKRRTERGSVRALAGAGLFSAALIGAALLGGCAAEPPVGEYDTTYRYYRERPGVYRENLAPVGEQGPVIGNPNGAYYNTITRSWERPWPYGPADATSPGYW